MREVGLDDLAHDWAGYRAAAAAAFYHGGNGDRRVLIRREGYEPRVVVALGYLRGAGLGGDCYAINLDSASGATVSVYNLVHGFAHDFQCCRGDSFDGLALAWFAAQIRCDQVAAIGDRGGVAGHLDWGD